MKMKRILQTVGNISIIFTASAALVIAMHLINHQNAVQTEGLLNLLITACATQVVSAAMEHVSIRPAALHMLAELLLMEGLVFLLGYLLGFLGFSGPKDICVDALLITFVYAVTVLYYSLSVKSAADEINRHLKNRNR